MIDVVEQINEFCNTNLIEDDLIIDGKIHRVRAGKSKAKSAWYVLFATQLAKKEVINGSYGYWVGANSNSQTLKSSYVTQNHDERAKIKESRERIRKIAAQKAIDDAKTARRLIANVLKKRVSATGQSDYAKRKMINPVGALFPLSKGEIYPGVSVDTSTLVLPIENFKGQKTAIQFILKEKIGSGKDASDKFLWPQGCVKAGSFIRLGSTVQNGQIVIICEGYATGASIHQATGYNVLCAIDVGNIREVAEKLRAYYPKCRIVIAADDDFQRWNSKKTALENIGVLTADDVAKRINGYVVVPKFKDRGDNKWTDFNDLHVNEDLETVKEQIFAVTNSDKMNDWWLRIRKTASGASLATPFNLSLVLQNDPFLAGLIAYDEFANSVIKTRRAPWGEAGNVQDFDISKLRIYIEEHYGFSIRSSDMHELLDAHARDNRFHPVRDYLHSGEWDEIDRLSTFAQLALGTEDNEYNSLALKKWIVGAVARVMSPGTKMDNMIVLEGKQGLKKSTFLKVMAGEWFSDSSFNMQDKSAKEQLQGIWIYEIAEMDSHNKADATLAKLFMSTSEDNFRAAYAKRAEKIPRQTVFAGSTNQHEYLKDPTGARRYWPISCTKIDIDYVADVRDQIWYQALHLYNSRFAYWLEDKDRDLFEEQQEDRLVGDGMAEVIYKYLYEGDGRNLEKVQVSEIQTMALKLDPGKITAAINQQVGSIMSNKLKWTKSRPNARAGQPRPSYYLRPVVVSDDKPRSDYVEVW